MAKAPSNLIGEWFGHRVYPTVAGSTKALVDQQSHRCPFLSAATDSTVACVKGPKSRGVCTISSTSNGARQDWIVCPYRAIHTGLIEEAARRMFEIPAAREVIIKPATTLKHRNVRDEVNYKLNRGDAVFAYVQDKLGGEVSLRATARSPQLSFDVTLVELTPSANGPAVGRYSILEVQTMDFHGSYSHAVKNLDDALRLHTKAFHAMVRKNVEWVSKKIEGPNIANVFKRTLYQMLLKFRLAGNGACAGAALALPAAVWDSWQRYLGAPELQRATDGTYRLAHTRPAAQPRAWIYIFDIDGTSAESPNPITISKVIGTDVDAVTHYAFKAAPDAILAEGGAHSLVLAAIKKRLGTWWPELGL